MARVFKKGAGGANDIPLTDMPTLLSCFGREFLALKANSHLGSAFCFIP